MVQVGDRIRVLVDGANCANVKKGDEFIVRNVRFNGGVDVDGSPSWGFDPEYFEIVGSTYAPKDPIEYLKSAYADGDMIDPATMLRECFGITKTERVVVEWSEVKREIKVGDKVRIVGNKWAKDGWAHRFEIGDIVEITEIDPLDKNQPYRAGVVRGWLAADDVELV